MMIHSIQRQTTCKKKSSKLVAKRADLSDTNNATCKYAGKTHEILQFHDAFICFLLDTPASNTQERFLAFTVTSSWSPCHARQARQAEV
jgi:hypothetical protein